MQDLSERIRKIINPTLDETYKRHLKRFRDKHIPEAFNQVHLMDQLTNPEIDYYIDISNRSDGKTFNYFHALINTAIEFDLGIMFIARRARERADYQLTFEEVIDISDIYDLSDFTYIRTERYIEIIYRNKISVGIITDLSQATPLKRISAFIKKYPILVYDEFIALEGDYLPDEYRRLKTIYDSVDRHIEPIPLIQFPKIFLLGNAENFSSPILNGLNLFTYMENHPINTQHQYNNILLGMYRNDTANERRNSRAFQSDDDAMTTGQFELNKYMIATEEDKARIRKNQAVLHVKLSQDYLQVKYNRDTYESILAIVHVADNYQFNLLLKDNKENSIYLKENYYDDKQVRRINRGKYLFENMYSKDYITTDFDGLNFLKVDKLVRKHNQQIKKLKPVEVKEIQYQDTYVEDTKKSLFNKFFGR